MAKKKDVYITRSTYRHVVVIFPATVGIRKFHGCVAWGAAWHKAFNTERLRARCQRWAETISFGDCRERFGFVPRSGTAWLVEYNAKGKRKKSKVDIDYS